MAMSAELLTEANFPTHFAAFLKGIDDSEITHRSFKQYAKDNSLVPNITPEGTSSAGVSTGVADAEAKEEPSSETHPPQQLVKLGETLFELGWALQKKMVILK